MTNKNFTLSELHEKIHAILFFCRRTSIYTFLVFVFISCVSKGNSTTVSTIIDSIEQYVDTMPELKEFIEQSEYWKTVKDKEVFYSEQEFENLKKKIKEIYLSNDNIEIKRQNMLRFVDYILKSELKEYNTKHLNKEQLREIYDQLTSYHTYINNNIDCITEGKWFNSDKLLLIVGQTHEYNYSEEEKTNVKQSQENIFKFCKFIFSKYVNLQIIEGLPPSEIDARIPHSISKSFAKKNSAYNSAIILDSIFESLYTYGCEDKETYIKASGISKEVSFFYYFIQEDSLHFPQEKNNLLKNYIKHIAIVSEKYPMVASRFDSTKAMNDLRELTRNDSIITKKRAREIYNNMYFESNKIVINQRNRKAVEAIFDIFTLTNQQTALLKIGEAHVNKDNIYLRESGFSEEIVTIQDLCEENNISYILVNTNKTYIKRD